MPIRQIAHICIHCPDLTAALDFYTRALGFRKVFNFTKEGKVTGAYLEIAPQSYLELFEHTVAHATQPRLNHFALETDDIYATQRHLHGHGIPTTEIKTGGDGTLQFWVTDPANTAIEFHQYTPTSSQLTGQDVEMDWEW